MTVVVVRSTWVSIYFKPISCSKFGWLICCIVYEIYYFLYLTSLIIYCPFSGDIYLSSVISLSNIVFFCFTFNCPWTILYEVLDTFVTLSAILLPIKLPVVSAIFWITVFEAVLSACVADCLAWSKIYWLYLLLKFLLNF